MNLKCLLKKTGLVESLWDTPLYSFFRKIGVMPSIDPPGPAYDFYRRLIRDFQIPTSLWFDVGANTGSKAIIFSRFARRIIAMEPDPNNTLILKRRFRFRPRVTILETAAGAASGIATMTVGAGAYSTLADKRREQIENSLEYAVVRSTHGHTMETKEVEVASLDDLIIRYGLPGYIKIDVEGHEEAVLKGISRTIPLISFEANLPDFKEETIRCIQHLASTSDHARFNFVLTEPPLDFSSESWLSQGEIIEIVKNGSHVYMEIYARSSL